MTWLSYKGVRGRVYAVGSIGKVKQLYKEAGILYGKAMCNADNS